MYPMGPLNCSTGHNIGKFLCYESNPTLSQTVRAQKQIPALPRLSRYMNRNYKLDKDTTQRLLDLAVEDNLVKLHKKVHKLLMSKVWHKF